MNTKRGLFRVWVVVSLLWGIVVGWRQARCLIGTGGPNCVGFPYDLTSESIVAAMFAIVPPVAVLLLGYAVLWAVKGFRSE